MTSWVNSDKFVEKFLACIIDYYLLLVTIIECQVCYEERIPLDTKCPSPPARCEVLAAGGFASEPPLNVYKNFGTCVPQRYAKSKHVCG
jgi:hypothetical protein